MFRFSEACAEYQRQRAILAPEEESITELTGLACLFAGITVAHSFVPALIGTTCVDMMIPAREEDQASFWQLRTAKGIGICSGELAKRTAAVAMVPSVVSSCTPYFLGCCILGGTVCVAHKTGCLKQVRVLEATMQVMTRE